MGLKRGRQSVNATGDRLGTALSEDLRRWDSGDMHRWARTKFTGLPVCVQVYLFLIVYSVWFTGHTGFIGFVGDTWQIINLSWDKNLTESWASVSGDFRMIEALFWIGEFKLIGLNSYGAHFISLLLQATSVLMFGKALTRVFQGSRSLISISMLFAFFYPATSYLTFLTHTDNSRLAGIFFWASVLFFQRFAEDKAQARQYLVVGGILYIVSFLTYENYSFMLFGIPFLLGDNIFSMEAIKKRYRKYGVLFAYLCLFFLICIFVRYKVLSGGAVAMREGTLLAKAETLVQYYGVGFSYLVEPVIELPVAIGTNVAVMSLVLVGGALLALGYSRNGRGEMVDRRQLISVSSVGLALSLLGILPYVLGGYEPLFGLSSRCRIFSSFAFALAICLGGLTGYLKQRRVTKGLSFALMFLVPVFVVAHVSLAKDWQIAAAYQKKLWSSMLDCCPDVEDGTAFILLDTQTYTGRAVVAEGTDGTKALAQIMYRNPSISAHFAYSRAEGSLLEDYPAERVTLVSKSGVKPRGAPVLDSSKVIILRNEDYEFRLVDLSEKDDLLFRWDGRETLTTNRSLIKVRRVENAFAEYLDRLPNLSDSSLTRGNLRGASCYNSPGCG